MTPKQRIMTILDGGIPDAPPHWELVFDIEKEFFGIDATELASREYPSERQRADAAIAGYEGAGVFWMPNGDEIMDFVVRLFERPDEMHEEARRKCDRAKTVLRGHVEAGADFLLLTYDFGYNNAPFVSPAHFAEFVTPYLHELVEEAHSLGTKAILHSDGCLSEILDQIHSTGIDGYQSVDPQGHMDIRAVRDRYPDWILMGNVECSMLQDTRPDEIRRSVDYCMDYGGIGKRYIFSTSNCIFAGMPPESYRAMHAHYKARIGEVGPE
jgi:uroporphyrinogen decarboxylase